MRWDHDPCRYSDIFLRRNTLKIDQNLYCNGYSRDKYTAMKNSMFFKLLIYFYRLFIFIVKSWEIRIRSRDNEHRNRDESIEKIQYSLKYTGWIKLVCSMSKK